MQFLWNTSGILTVYAIVNILSSLPGNILDHDSILLYIDIRYNKSFIALMSGLYRFYRQEHKFGECETEAAELSYNIHIIA